MNSLKLSIGFCTIALTCFVAVSSRESEKCDVFKDMDKDYEKKILDGFATCEKKFSGDDKGQWHKAKKNYCFFVCFEQVKGVLDDKGSFNKTAMEEFAKQRYATKEITEKMIEGIASCAKDSGLEDSKALSMDDNCKAYEQFDDCWEHKQEEVCKTVKKCGGHEYKKLDETYRKKHKEALKACFVRHSGSDGVKKLYKHACHDFCSFQADGVFDDKGAYTKSGAEERVKQYFPTKEIIDVMIAGYNSCAEENGLGDGKVLSMDGNCSAYDPFIDCERKKVREACGIQ